MNLNNIEESYFNPQKNEDAIVIVKQTDGNWKGWCQKFGKVVSARQKDPQEVLQLLLTHSGKDDEIISV